jgi:hypothetical protein
MVQGRFGNAYGLWFTTERVSSGGEFRLKLRFTAIGANSLEKAQSAPRLQLNLIVVQPAGTSGITPLECRGTQRSPQECSILNFNHGSKRNRYRSFTTSG